MYHRIGLVLLFLFLGGCAEENKINIGDIILNQATIEQNSTVEDKYISFTQEYHDNIKYPVSEYCNDKRALLTDDKFSTEIYLKVENERTKEKRVSKYPIWFLLNDDARNIQCVVRSTNFINEEPFVVNANDKLNLKIFQKNQDEKRVPIRELGVLINFIGLLVPPTANFLLKSNNLINDPITKNYLNSIESAFEKRDLDGTKSREFTTKIKSIKIKLIVPQKDLKQRDLGYIILKPKYRTTLSTVETVKGIPNFKYIFSIDDPRVEDIINYKFKSTNMTIRQEINNFRHLSDEYIIDALNRLNSQLINRFTSYDRGLILTLALKETSLYKRFLQAIRNNNIKEAMKYLKILDTKDNPLNNLSRALNLTGIEYYRLMYSANRLIKNAQMANAERIKEEERKREEEMKKEIELQNIQNFLIPVIRWSYIPRMFSKDAKIIDTKGESYTIADLQKLYNREDSVAYYGCFLNLQNKIHGIAIQNYLIHPNYTDGIKYNYMAISMDKNRTISTFFYKFTSNDFNNIKIENILIDKDGYFIMKSRLKEVLSRKDVKMCRREILSNI